MSQTESSNDPAPASPEATVAAKWWSDKLRFGATLDNGDTSEMGGMTMAVAILAQGAQRQSQDLSEEKIGKFESMLARRIDDMLMQQSSAWGVIVSVDYWPNDTLTGAARFADIDLDMILLPWKTTMTIKHGEVSVNGTTLPL